MSLNRDDGIDLGRRRDQRFAVELNARVTAGGVEQDATTKDVSRGGICFVIKAPIDTSAPFEISLSLVLDENRASEPLSLQGTVVWCTETKDGFQIGAAFTGMNQDSKEYLQMFLNFLSRGVPLDTP